MPMPEGGACKRSATSLFLVLLEDELGSWNPPVNEIAESFHRGQTLTAGCTRIKRATPSTNSTATPSTHLLRTLHLRWVSDCFHQ